MAASAPTGCFKCGRPGHWSRDCPSAPPSSSTGNPTAAAAAASSRFATYLPRQPPKQHAAAAAEGAEAADQGGGKKRKERATRPKLTPDLLLSDGGLGFVLRYFPKAFKPRARPGHEVEDLGNLIKLYTDWHSRLIPYYSFEQFVRKVEKVGASKRVRRCISELKDRVARGGDPTKLHEPSAREVTPEDEPDGTTHEDPILGTESPLMDDHVTDLVQEDVGPLVESNNVEEDLLNEIYEKADDEPGSRPGEGGAGEPLAPREAEKYQDGEEIGGSKPSRVELTEEQRARMEANRLKALERAAAARARASQSQPTTETTT